MSTGDVVGNVIWLTGTETPELINQYKRDDYRGRQAVAIGG